MIRQAVLLDGINSANYFVFLSQTLLQSLSRYEINNASDGANDMTKDKLKAIAMEAKANGKSDDEIRAMLFNVKGARVAQILKVMKELAAQ